jgi:hypothetical protein
LNEEKQIVHVEKETRKTKLSTETSVSVRTTANKSLKVGDDTYVSRRVLIHEQSASRDTYTISALLDVLIMIHDAHLGAIFSTSLPFVKKKHGNSCN